MTKNRVGTIGAIFNRMKEFKQKHPRKFTWTMGGVAASGIYPLVQIIVQIYFSTSDVTEGSHNTIQIIHNHPPQEVHYIRNQSTTSGNDVSNRLPPKTSEGKIGVEENVKQVTLKPKSLCFNQSGGMRNNIALFLTAENELDLVLQQMLSDEVVENNIILNTNLFNSTSLPFYNKFYNPSLDWIEEIELNKFTKGYIIGSISSETKASSEDSDITIKRLTFNGRLIRLADLSVQVIRASSVGTSYSIQDAESIAYSSLVKDIIEKIDWGSPAS